MVEIIEPPIEKIDKIRNHIGHLSTHETLEYKNEKSKEMLMVDFHKIKGNHNKRLKKSRIKHLKGIHSLL